jgi:protein required for attachment to host cells
MARALTLWIAIVDGEHARFVQPDGDHVLRTVQAVDSAAAHQRSRDIGADRPGRSYESATSAHHSVGERHDPHVMAKEKFARFVAEQLNTAAVRDEFDELLIIAPARVLQALREALHPRATAKVVGTLDKDLVKTPNHELGPHVREWVSPPRRAFF